MLSSYVATALDYDLPPEVVAATKRHVLDTFAAMVSGSRLKPGDMAARYVESLGGAPQASVIGTGNLTSAVDAAFANAMAAHADETDDTNPIGPIHMGCGAVAAAFAVGELKGRNGTDLIRAVAVGYDIGARVVAALGVGITSRQHDPSCLTTSFIAAASAAAMLRLDELQVRHTFSYAAQQASGIGSWRRDREHIEKAFDYAGMGARNGVMAATMVAFGFTGVDDPFNGDRSIFTALADRPAPDKLVAGLGKTFAILDTSIKRWSVGAPLQAMLDSLATLLGDTTARSETIDRVVVDIPAVSFHLVDNNGNPDLCAQHLVALMIADRGVTFASLHDMARMRDPAILALRRLVELVPSATLPELQANVRIDLVDGRSISHLTKVVRGTAANPMDTAEVNAKAFDLMAPVLGVLRAKELIAAIADLESYGPVTNLRPLLRL